MVNRHTISFTVIMGFACIGLLYSIFFEPSLFFSQLIIPVIVCAVVFVLYRLSPGQRRHPVIKRSARTEAQVRKTSVRASDRAKRKTVPFRVIEGSKGKNDADDSLPKFH